mgnify:CR=1 FL=1
MIKNIDTEGKKEREREEKDKKRIEKKTYKKGRGDGNNKWALDERVK